MRSFDFNASFSKALAVVKERTSLRTDSEAMALALTITRRDANVVRMARSPLFSPDWETAVDRVAKCDEELEKWGLG